MPYIPESDRERFEGALDVVPLFRSVGEMNFFITRVCLDHLKRIKSSGAPVGYSALNDVLGVLSAVPLEFYRRYVSIYEDRKIATNGDVYETN